MKTTPKNNPVVVGALMGILVVALILLIKQMSARQVSAVVITPVLEAPADSPPPSAVTVVPLVSAVGQRDPFDHPALHRIAKEGAPAQNLTTATQAAQEAARLTPPGSKMPVRIANHKPTSEAAVKPTLNRISVSVFAGRNMLKVHKDGRSATLRNAASENANSTSTMQSFPKPVPVSIRDIGSGLYDVDSYQADAAGLLKSVAERGQAGVVALGVVNARVTVTLRHVTTTAALEILAKALGLSTRLDGNVYIVGSRKDLDAGYPAPLPEPMPPASAVTQPKANP